MTEKEFAAAVDEIRKIEDIDEYIAAMRALHEKMRACGFNLKVDDKTNVKVRQ